MYSTCVVVLGAVAKAFLLFQHKLGERQIICHLHRSHIQPFKNKIIHGVANWKGVRENVYSVKKKKKLMAKSTCNVLNPDLKDELTAFQLHCTRLAVHGKVFQVHGTGKGKCQPGKQKQQHHKGTGMVCKRRR